MNTTAVIEQSGLLSALPHAVMAGVVPIAGYIADFLRTNYLSTTVVRKLFNCCGTSFQLQLLIFIFHRSYT